eukprot:546932-Rhodomonas_salina.1
MSAICYALHTHVQNWLGLRRPYASLVLTVRMPPPGRDFRARIPLLEAHVTPALLPALRQKTPNRYFP